MARIGEQQFQYWIRLDDLLQTVKYKRIKCDMHHWLERAETALRIAVGEIPEPVDPPVTRNEGIRPNEHELNCFTLRLKELIEKNGPVTVRSQSGRIFRVIWRPESEDVEYDGFECPEEDGCHAWWYPNGRSVLTSDWDIMEIVE